MHGSKITKESRSRAEQCLARSVSHHAEMRVHVCQPLIYTLLRVYSATQMAPTRSGCGIQGVHFMWKLKYLFNLNWAWYLKGFIAANDDLWLFFGLCRHSLLRSCGGVPGRWIFTALTPGSCFDPSPCASESLSKSQLFSLTYQAWWRSGSRPLVYLVSFRSARQTRLTQ